MSSRNVGAVALVILLGLVIGTLGLVEADLYAVGVLLLFLGGVGAAALIGEYLIRYFSAKRNALARLAQLGDRAELEGQFQGKTVLDGAGPGLPPLACACVLPVRGLYLGHGYRSAGHGEEKVYGSLP
jgi:hypothetical protein